MASTRAFVDGILEQLAPLEGVTARPMFGEYTLYYRGKIIGLIADERLLVKPTKAGRAHIEKTGGQVVEASPYPGAKPCFLIADPLGGRKWLVELIDCSEPELPLPQKRRR